MKKTYLYFIAVAAAATAISCAKNDVEEPTPQAESHIVTFKVDQNDTRTLFGDKSSGSYPVLWKGGEKIEMAIGEGTETYRLVQNQITASIVGSEPTASASWSFDFATYYTTQSVTVSWPNKFYAFSPGENLRAFYNNSESRIKVESLPDVQTPTATSCDPSAMFLYSVSDEYASMPSVVELPAFKHMTAYGCLTLGDGIPADATVSQVIVTANTGKYLAGAAWFNYATETWVDYTEATAGITPTESITIVTSSKSNIWFACRPTHDLSTLTVEVVTDKGLYTKTINVPADKNFTAGEVSAMTVNGFAKTTKQYTYTWNIGQNDGAIVIGSGSAAIAVGTDSGKLTWSGKVASYEATIGAFTWSIAATATGTKYDVANGASNNRHKFGTGNDLLSPLTFTTTIPSYFKVTNVAVWALLAADGTANASVTVGGNAYVNSAIEYSTAAAVKPTGKEYSGSGTSTGDVVVTITSDKPFFMYKIVITYEI